MTDLNIADCATRGVNKFEFEHHTWWKGPSFIKNQLSQNHNRLFSVEQEGEQREKIAIVLQTSADIEDELLEWKRINQLRTAKRITKNVLRFIKKLLMNINEELRKRVLRSISVINSVTADYHNTQYGYGQRNSVKNTDKESSNSTLLAEVAQKPYKKTRTKTNTVCFGVKDESGISDESLETKQSMLIIPQNELAEAMITFHSTQERTRQWLTSNVEFGHLD
ncbi:hypothetical protein KIN20_023827 [Parelaphostrongylus tenuis]|uniref:Uncharacterized protein n=1 Tax=Parelaphostrongylus tenuis TaxID=148309 RepID=A0AAD5MXI5_PARTN|nr:hypothetical protein KIN20_023827 [Parelaphostrongylus tenuis]